MLLYLVLMSCRSMDNDSSNVLLPLQMRFVRGCLRGVRMHADATQ
jgi:hypothetical protein